ncbi:Hcp family type VI secretion system effector [Planctobacterium marinum]|uniref:Hcp family type VI secretion system effector n=1 Tax=Planctobacterium marinum TaxID=1631968 RepID=UPI001E483092|nr:type VI secretion system tube protein Hcp [Planctobacterium marinum]MCC2604307.1 type VI secretion system tube protein Hcp [Planctobacterium marinum]
MDLVLLKPGRQELAGASMIDGELMTSGEDLSGCIELVSMGYGFKQQMTTNVSNSARTSGRPDMEDLKIVKYIDKASPLLYKHMLSATPIDDGIEPTQLFLCRNANIDGDGNSIIGNIVTVKLFNCMISSIETQSHANDMATEQLTLNFTDIEWTTSEQDSQANTTGNYVFFWSET